MILPLLRAGHCLYYCSTFSSLISYHLSAKAIKPTEQSSVLSDRNMKVCAVFAKAMDSFMAWTSREGALIKVFQTYPGEMQYCCCKWKGLMRLRLVLFETSATSKGVIVEIQTPTAVLRCNPAVCVLWCQQQASPGAVPSSSQVLLGLLTTLPDPWL